MCWGVIIGAIGEMFAVGGAEAGAGVAAAGAGTGMASAGAFTGAAGGMAGLSGATVAGTTGAVSGMTVGQWLMLASSAIGAGGSIYSGEKAKDAAKDQAEAQRKAAISAENVGAQQSADNQMKSRRIQAAQITAAGAGGVDPSTGTPLTLVGQTAEWGELDSLRIINNASLTAWGMNTQANITEAQGNQAEFSGYVSGASTLLGGASNAYYSGKSPYNISLGR